jgi:hypothetical protein
VTESSADLLGQLLADPDRAPLPGASQVVSFRDDDEPEYLAQLAERSVSRLLLQRRGHWHGQIAELDPESVPATKLPRPSHLRQRWREARPFVLRRMCTDRLREWSNDLHLADRWGADLLEPQGLTRFLSTRLGGRGGRFAAGAAYDELTDPERDLAKHALLDREAGADATAGDASRALQLWVKCGRLSDHPDDASVRVRLGAGDEGADDAGRDPGARKALRAAGRAVLPLLGELDRDRELWKRIGEVAGTPLVPSHAIAYWNRLEGGARFHHDAFADVDDVQRGVLYVQLAGRTVWLALSIGDLADQWIEFAALMLEDELPWLKEAFEAAGVWEPALAVLEGGRTAALRELGEPGCGALGPWVDRGPEFTAFLIDAGHATVLHPGDALCLPNNGRLSTAMHSVFCGGPGPNYALSLGLFPPN